MRLGVSPAAASTPTGVFNQRFEALFPHAGALGCEVCFVPPLFLPVYLCVNVGPWGLLVVALPALLVPQSASLWVRPHCHESPLPWLPVSAPPTGLDECFFISLVVGLRCSLIFCQFWLFLILNCGCPSFCCARRCSVSTPPPSWFGIPHFSFHCPTIAKWSRACILEKDCLGFSMAVIHSVAVHLQANYLTSLCTSVFSCVK